MLKELSIRNAKRQSKDYLLYFITLACTVSFMYAFNSLIFSDIVKAFPSIGVLPYMIIVPGEETELRECLSKISTEGTGKADCVPIQALLKAMNSNFCDVGNKIYHIIVVLSNSGVYWESDEEYEKLRELLVNQWCASNRAQKILILFTPNKTPWDEIGLELDNTIRVDTDYTFYNELTIKTLKKWIARVIGYVVDW